MELPRRQFLQLTLGTAALPAVSCIAMAQTYPTKPVRLIIPFPPGGSNDIIGRAIATQMSERLGKQVVVDNRTGAGAIVGTEIASKAPADGYTILIVSLAHSLNPSLYKLPYDPIEAFTPIGIIAIGTSALTVHPSLPAHSVKDLIAMAKAKPGELTYASSGVGTFQHLTAELFKLQAKVDLMHIAFRGGGPALIDVLGGHNKIMFSSVVNVVPHVKSGRLRALGTGGTQRSPALPTCRRSRRLVFPVTRRTNGGASLRPRGPRRRSSRGCTRYWRKCRTCRSSRRSSKRKAPPSRR